MAMLFKFGCFYTMIISLGIIKMTSCQWSEKLLQSPDTCEDKYHFINAPCVTDSDCMRRFIQCQCIPQELLDVLLDSNNLPLEPETICIYSIYVMEIGEPICCDYHKRNMPMTTPASLSSTWKLMIGNRFPIPSYHKKQPKLSDYSSTTKISKKSETLHDLIEILRGLIREEGDGAHDNARDDARDGTRDIIATETNVNIDDRDDLDVKDIRDIKKQIKNDIKQLVYRLLYDLKQGK